MGFIIKKWGGSAFDEIYPKTTVADVFLADGTTPAFSGGKIAVSLLPNSVFDSLYFYNIVAENITLATLADEARVDAAATNRSSLGYYWVSNGLRQFTANESISTQIGSFYYRTVFTPGDGGQVSAVGAIFLETGDWVVITKITGAGTEASPFIVTFAVVNNTYETADATTHGIVKLGSNTQQSVAANTVTATSSRTYAIQNNASGQLVVNVPWVDTNTTYAVATSTTLGLVELFSDTQQSVAANAVTATTSRTYGIQLNGQNQAVVNVPWTDTTYSQATASTLGTIKLITGTQQSVAAESVTATTNRTYGLQVNADGQGVINVPWVNTTYSLATATSLGLIELFNATTQSVAANAVSTTANRTYGLQVNSDNQGVINVPWTDTTYSAGTGITLSTTTFSHADTSSVADLTGANGVVVNGLTFDTFGHVQTRSTVDLDGRYYTETEMNTALGKRKEFYVQADAPTPTETDAIWFDI
jgi:hypothetical protein